MFQDQDIWPSNKENPSVCWHAALALSCPLVASSSASPKPHPSKPHPCNMPQAKTEVALQFLECCAAETALQHSLFCSADVICTKSCAATNEKLHCNIEIAALQEDGAFLPLSCGFQAPTFRHPRFGLADKLCNFVSRSDLVLILFWMLTMSWIYYPISLFRRASRFLVFKQSGA